MIDRFAPAKAAAKPVWLIAENARSELPDWAQPWAETMQFKGQAGRILPLPDGKGALAGLALGIGSREDPFILGVLAKDGPAGDWAIAGALGEPAATRAALAFGLGAYEFTRYKTSAPKAASRLVPPDNADMPRIRRTLSAVKLVRDLINTPAEDMGPENLGEAALDLAKQFGAKAAMTIGDDLIASGWPLVHAVGRASPRAPRVVDFQWGDPALPKVTLVGKGVCFDTGGLDIKPSSGMALMKKDMGGAANILGLASLVMSADLRLRLRVIVPIVDNNIAGNAYRTSDIFKSRKGLTVEIGNTDAEGRLILADALAAADEEGPEILIDLATLTGAARTALGPELPAVYCDDDRFFAALSDAALSEADPLWRLPLWTNYAKGLESRIADLKSTSEGAFAGSIYGALFLKRFVGKAKTWVHGDIYAWNTEARPGRPYGGEAQTIRALFAALAARFAP